MSEEDSACTSTAKTALQHMYNPEHGHVCCQTIVHSKDGPSMLALILGNIALSSAVTNLLEQRSSPSPLAGTQWTSSCSMMFRSCPEWYASCFVCHMYGVRNCGHMKDDMTRKWGS